MVFLRCDFEMLHDIFLILRLTRLHSRRGTKAVVGTQLGILSIFNRNKGWGDCVDRVPG